MKSPRLMRGDLTSGECATILNVASRTVAKWCDRGILKHYRLPLSTDRRVRAVDLKEFLESHGMPVPDAIWEVDASANGVNAAHLRKKASVIERSSAVFAGEVARVLRETAMEIQLGLPVSPEE